MAPHNREAEQSVLGAILLDASALERLNGLKRGDFYVPAHEAIFEAIGALEEAGGPVEATSVVAELSRRGELAKVGGTEAITRLVDSAPVTSSVDFWANLVIDAARRRDLIHRAGQIQDLARGAESADVVEARAVELLTRSAGASETASSWHPVDLGPIWDGLIDGTVEIPAPTVGQREAGGGLFYPSRINGVFGRFGSAKSYVAAVAALQEIDAGRRVFWIDLEDNPTGMTQRLIELGADRAHVVESFRYVNPVEALDPRRRAELFGRVDEDRPSLVVVDSTGEWLSLQGAKPNYDEEVAAFTKAHLAPLAASGAAVVTIDHIPHDARDPLRAIGSQRKMASITGAVYLVDMVVEMGKGRRGMSRLQSAKDRLGTYPRETVVAELHLDATTMPYGIRLAAPEPSVGADGPLPDEKPATRRVYAALLAAGSPVGTRRLGDIIAGDGAGYGLKARTIQDALARLRELNLAQPKGSPHTGYQWAPASTTHAHPELPDPL
jgi:hypothetical protein